MSHDCSLSHPGTPVCSAGGGIRSVAEAAPATALPLEPHTEAEEARLARTEAAEPAEESLRERVARAVCAVDAFGDHTAWAESQWLRSAYLAMAAAAIEAMKGPSPAEEALARVEALAEEAGTVPRWSTPPDDAHEKDWRTGYAAAMQDFADRLAAIAAPVAQASGTEAGA